MDFQSSEHAKLQNIIKEWISYPDRELETTFGKSGNVDATQFLTIATRLRSIGYEPLPESYYLNIITPSNVRFTIHGLGVIQQYCKDGILQGKPFIAMIKDKVGTDNVLDMEEYDMKIKLRREVPVSNDDITVQELINNWTTQNKAFRLISRWSFQKQNVRVDMSFVRSTTRTTRGEFRWTKSSMSSILTSAPQYEVEVELLREIVSLAPVSADKSDISIAITKSVTSLVAGIGDVLRAIQKNTLLIRNSVKAEILRQYMELNKNNRFRGVNPVTLESRNISVKIESDVVNIRKGYNITDKADGLRVLAFCSSSGELFMIDMSMTVYRTGLQNKDTINCLLDGELLKQDKAGNPINQLLLFDIYRSGEGEDVSQLPFVVPEDTAKDSRFRRLNAWMLSWKNATFVSKYVNDINRLQIAMKQYEVASADPRSIFMASAKILDAQRVYNTDGLIYTPNSSPLPERSGETFYEQFKWKPVKDNTIDFLVNYEKDPDNLEVDKTVLGIHPDTDETVKYKVLRLYVGSSKDPIYDDPRRAILEDMTLPSSRGAVGGKYQPVLFNPTEFPDTMSSISYRPVVFNAESGEEYAITESGEPINDRSIIEMRYDSSAAAGWRWIPTRIRHDKTERLQSGQLMRTLNNDKVANSIWNSIHDPITEFMIRSGSEQPSEEESKLLSSMKRLDVTTTAKYYEKKAASEDLMLVRGLRNFHNLFIKDLMLYGKVFGKGGEKGVRKKLVDVAVGKAGDLQRWKRGGASFVFGVDISTDNIRNPGNGAYKRYMDTLIEHGKDNTPVMIFAIGDSSRSIVDGEAGATQEEKDIMKSIFGRIPPTGPVPKAIEKYSAGILRTGADICSAMFSLHYFFESEKTLSGFLKNLEDVVKVGGHFIGCCFDGYSVFELLKNTVKGRSYTGRHGSSLIWSIAKEYETESLVPDSTSVGLAVDVEFISIGTTHREYLVSFDYLKQRLAGINFHLESTELFSTSYKKASGEGKKFAMEPTVAEFSFLNRWFVFKRGDAVPVVDDTVHQTVRPPVPVASASATTTTVPVGAPPVPMTMTVPDAVASSQATGEKRIYMPAEIFLFHNDAKREDILRIGEPGAGQWLSPSAFFPIQDSEEPEIVYPSIKHYLEGMKLKHIAKKPDVARNLMSTTGSIHQKYLSERILQKSITEISEIALQKKELDDVKQTMTPTKLGSFGIKKINENEWNSIKDRYLYEAIKQRWTNDKRFHSIVEAVRNSGKYLLYYSREKSSEFGGLRDTDGTIKGDNKIGKMIMDIANWNIHV